MGASRSKVPSAGGVDFDFNYGVPNASSVYGAARFICGPDGVDDDFFPDDDIARMLLSGEAVQYAARDGRILPASAITEDAAINLFMGGAAEVEDPVVNGREAETLAAVSSLMGVFLGVPTTPGVVDFRSAGKLWALTGYALRKEYLYERDPAEDAKRLYEGALAAEAQQGAVSPALAFEGEGRGPRP